MGLRAYTIDHARALILEVDDENFKPRVKSRTSVGKMKQDAAVE